MMGLFLGALDNPITNDTMTARQQFVFTAKQMGQRSWNSCKTFAVMGLVFSAAECIVEKVKYLLFTHTNKDVPLLQTLIVIYLSFKGKSKT